MIFVGIDPGQKGAIAIIDSFGIADVIDMPVINKEIDAKKIYEFLKKEFFDYHIDVKDIFCLIEKSQSMPGQGVRSVFSYGKGYGKLIAILECFNINFVELHPVKWKRYFNLIKKNKNESIREAEKKFKNIKIKNDGQAEALLIAKYAKLNYSKEG
jgi:crossover junction endodeoxyribonuclease RuvC